MEFEIVSCSAIVGTYPAQADASPGIDEMFGEVVLRYRGATPLSSASDEELCEAFRAVLAGLPGNNGHSEAIRTALEAECDAASVLALAGALR